jgi:hypothetical protein
MPRFFFDVVFAEHRIDDVEGQELPGIESARIAAARVFESTLAHSLLRDEAAEGAVLEIRDADGILVETFQPTTPRRRPR